MISSLDMVSFVTANAAFLPKSLNPSLLSLSPKVTSFPCPFFISIKTKLSIGSAVSHVLANKRVSSVLSHLIDPEKVDSMLSFLKERGFTTAQLERIATCCPVLLSTNPGTTIEPKLEIFEELGLSASEIAAIISRDPHILRCSTSTVTASLSIFKNLLGSDERLAKVLRSNMRLIRSNTKETLLPNIGFLKSCGISMAQITNLLYIYPNFLMIKPETMRNAVRKVDKMGVERTSKMFIYAVQVVGTTSKEAWELKLKIFEDLGFSEDDIKRMLRRSPLVFNNSEDKIKKVKEVLLETGMYDVSCIISHPISLMYSVEKRYKPRLEVLKVLQMRNLIEKWPPLTTLCKTSNRSFFQKFVEPYMEELGETTIVMEIRHAEQYMVEVVS